MEAAAPTTTGGDPGEEAAAPNAAATTKLRLLCSHGGQILPRPHDKSSLYYAGGDTRLVSVPRHAALADFRSTLSRLFGIACAGGDGGGGFFLKYQLPSEGLDCLVSVASEEDLENMVVEYDRVAASAGKPARLRLFLFPAKNPKAPPPMPVVSVFDDAKLESWFADAALGDGAGKVPGAHEVQSLPDSPLLDNSSSSFGTPSSPPSAGSGGGGGAPAVLEAQFSEINVSGKKLEECPKNCSFGTKDEAYEIKEGDFLPTPAAPATEAIPFVENPVQNGGFFSCGEEKSENGGISHSLPPVPDIAAGQAPTSDGPMPTPEKSPVVVVSAPADVKQGGYSYAHGRPQLVPVQPYYHQTIHPQYQMLYTPQIPAYFVPVQPRAAGYPLPVGSVQAPDMNDPSKIPLPSPVLLARGGAAKSELATSAAAAGNSHRTNAAAARSAVVAQPCQYVHLTDHQTPPQYMNFHPVSYTGAPSPAAGYAAQPLHYTITPPPPTTLPVATPDATAGTSDAPCNTAAEA